MICNKCLSEMTHCFNTESVPLKHLLKILQNLTFPYKIPTVITETLTPAFHNTVSTRDCLYWKFGRTDRFLCKDTVHLKSFVHIFRRKCGRSAVVFIGRYSQAKLGYVTTEQQEQ